MGFGIPCCPPTSPTLTLASSPLASFTSAFAAFHLSPSSLSSPLLDAGYAQESLQQSSLSSLNAGSEDVPQSSRLARIRSLPSSDALSSSLSSSMEQTPACFGRGQNDGSLPLLLPSEAEEQRNRIEQTQLWHAKQMQLEAEEEERWYAGNRKVGSVVDVAAAAAGLAYDAGLSSSPRSRAPSMESLCSDTSFSSTTYYSDFEGPSSSHSPHDDQQQSYSSYSHIEHAFPLTHHSTRFESQMEQVEMELPRRPEHLEMPYYEKGGFLEPYSPMHNQQGCYPHMPFPFPTPPPPPHLMLGAVPPPHLCCPPIFSGHIGTVPPFLESPFPIYHQHATCSCPHSHTMGEHHLPPATSLRYSSLWQTFPDPIYNNLRASAAPSSRGFGVPNGPSPNNKKAELYKTEMCRSWLETAYCRYEGKCQFAHGYVELRPVPRHQGRGGENPCGPFGGHPLDLLLNEEPIYLCSGEQCICKAGQPGRTRAASSPAFFQTTSTGDLCPPPPYASL